MSWTHDKRPRDLYERLRYPSIQPFAYSLRKQLPVEVTFLNQVSLLILRQGSDGQGGFSVSRDFQEEVPPLPTLIGRNCSFMLITFLTLSSSRDQLCQLLLAGCSPELLRNHLWDTRLIQTEAEPLSDFLQILLFSPRTLF